MQLGTGEGEYWSDGCICISAWRGVAWHATDRGRRWHCHCLRLRAAVGVYSVFGGTMWQAARASLLHVHACDAMRCDWPVSDWPPHHRSITPLLVSPSLSLSLGATPLTTAYDQFFFLSFFHWRLSAVAPVYQQQLTCRIGSTYQPLLL